MSSRRPEPQSELSDQRNFAAEGADPPPPDLRPVSVGLRESRRRRHMTRPPIAATLCFDRPLRALSDIRKARRRNARKVRKAFVTSRVHKKPFELFESEACVARSMPTSAMILGTQEGPAGDSLSSCVNAVLLRFADDFHLLRR